MNKHRACGRIDDVRRGFNEWTRSFLQSRKLRRWRRLSCQRVRGNFSPAPRNLLSTHLSEELRLMIRHVGHLSTFPLRQDFCWMKRRRLIRMITWRPITIIYVLARLLTVKRGTLQINKTMSKAGNNRSSSPIKSRKWSAKLKRFHGEI